MNKKFYIANWKSHKTEDEALSFFETFQNGILEKNLSDKEVVIAPPFTLLAKCRHLVDEYKLPISLCGQNASSYPEGAYTGEVSARQVKEFASYVIVGHSERRRYLHESESDIENKVREAIEQGLTVVQCIQDENDVVHHGVGIVAYEPPSAIGTGNPDTPEHIAEVFDVITSQNPTVSVLYGGSVAPENIQKFLQIEKLDGFLIGGASLEADSFLQLLSW